MARGQGQGRGRGRGGAGVRGGGRRGGQHRDGEVGGRSAQQLRRKGARGRARDAGVAAEREPAQAGTHAQGKRSLELRLAWLVGVEALGSRPTLRQCPRSSLERSARPDAALSCALSSMDILAAEMARSSWQTRTLQYTRHKLRHRGTDGWKQKASRRRVGAQASVKVASPAGETSHDPNSPFARPALRPHLQHAWRAGAQEGAAPQPQQPALGGRHNRGRSTLGGLWERARPRLRKRSRLLRCEVCWEAKHLS
jgi:hypothetical protein